MYRVLVTVVFSHSSFTPPEPMVKVCSGHTSEELELSVGKFLVDCAAKGRILHQTVTDIC